MIETKEKISVNDLLREVQRLDPVEFVDFNRRLGQIVKKTGTTDTIPHRTSRCHFKGTIKEIEEIEQIVLNKWAVAIIKDNKNERLFGCENVVRRKELSVILVSKVYAFPLWLMYDSRNGGAMMEVRDKDIWHLCGASDDMLERLGKLERKID